MIHSYATSRAKSRRVGQEQTLRITRHAVDENSLACGAMDTFCGQHAVVPLGAWESDNGRNCRICEAELVSYEEMSA